MRASELYGGGLMLGELVPMSAAAQPEIISEQHRYLRSGFMSSNLGTHTTEELEALAAMGLASPFVMTEQTVDYVVGAGGRFFRYGFTSTDGENWVAMTGATPNAFRLQQEIVFFDGAWYGAGNTYVVRSTDGVVWEATTQQKYSNAKFIVAFGVLFVVYQSGAGLYAARTSNGTTWINSGSWSINNSSWSVAFTGTKLVVAHNQATASDLKFRSTSDAATNFVADTGYSGMGTTIGDIASAGDGVLHFNVGSSRFATEPNSVVFTLAELGISEICSISGAILQRTQNGLLARINAGGTVDALGTFGQSNGTVTLNNLAITDTLSSLWVTATPNRFLLGGADLSPKALGLPTSTQGYNSQTQTYVRLKP